MPDLRDRHPPRSHWHRALPAGDLLVPVVSAAVVTALPQDLVLGITVFDLLLGLDRGFKFCLVNAVVE